MQKILSKAITLSMLVLVLTLSASQGRVQVTHAVVGSVSTPITKAIKSPVVTRYYFTGSGWTAGAPFWYEWQSSTTWTGSGTSAGFSADSGGAIPSTAKLDLLGPALAGTNYILLSQSSDGTAGVATVTITIKDTGPSFTIGSTSGQPGDTIEDVKGSGFTVGQSVALYLGTKALTTLTAATDGTISGTFTVPDIARPSPYVAYGVWAVQTDGASARYGTTSNSWTDFTVNPKITVDRVSIKGYTGETFVVTGRAWTAAETLSSPTIAPNAGGSFVESFQPVSPAPTVSSDGTFAATVYLSTAVGTYGPADMSITGSQTSTWTEAKALIVSTPDYPGDEGIALRYANRVVGKSNTVRLWNFPAGSSVTVSLGGSTWGTTSVDTNGAAKTSFTVPETIGGAYAVTARDSSGMMVTSSFTVDPNLELFRSDTGAKAYDTDDAKRPYVKRDTVLKLVGTGLAALTDYQITDSGTDIVTSVSGTVGGYVTGVTKGTLKATKVKTTSLGSMELTYKARGQSSSGTTGTDCTVLIVGTAASAVFNGLSDPVVTIDPWHGATTSAYTVTVTATNLIPATVYQILLDGAAQVISAGTDNYFLAEGTLGLSGSAPALTSIVVPLNIAAGVHTVAIVYYGQTTSLKDKKYVASTAAGTATITLSRTSAAYDNKVDVYGYNFAASESVTVKVVGTAISAAPTVYSDGAFKLEDPSSLIVAASYQSLPRGSYVIYADRASGTEPTATLTITAGMAISPTSGTIGDTLTYVRAYSLDPNSRYRVILDSTEAKGYVMTDNYGYVEVTTATVPAVLEGQYKLGWAAEASPTTAIMTKNFAVWNPANYPTAPVELSISPSEAVPMQQVKVKWKVAGLSTQDGNVKVTIRLSDYVVYSGLAPYDVDTIYAGFTMPNGDAELLKMTVSYADYASTPLSGTDYIAIKRISGSGSLIMGVDLGNDVAYIKTKVDSLAVSLSALDAKIVAVNGTVVTVNTKIGTLSTDITTINGKVDTIKGDVATVKTDLGTLSGKVVAVDGKVATIATDVGTLKTDVAATKTAATDAKTAATNAKTAVDAVQSTASGISTAVYGAIVLALVAAVASIVAVITLQRKIAG